MISLYALNGVIERLEKESSSEKHRFHIKGLSHTAKGLIAATICKKIDKPLVLISPNAAMAEELYDVVKLFLSGGRAQVLLFPAIETLPFEMVSPHPEISGLRLSALGHLLKNGTAPIVVTSVEALARRVISKREFAKSTLLLEKGDSLDLPLLIDFLETCGYNRVDMVSTRGEFSVRGGIVDIFSADLLQPVRLEFFGDEIESIRHFDLSNQRSCAELAQVTLLPCRELLNVDEEGNELRGRLYNSACEKNGLDPDVYTETAQFIRAGVSFAGMERLLPLFDPEETFLHDYLPEGAAYIVDEPESLAEHIKQFYEQIEEGRENRFTGKDPVPAGERLFAGKQKLLDLIDKNTIVDLQEMAIDTGAEGLHLAATLTPEKYKGETGRFFDDLDRLLKSGFTVLLSASSGGIAERLKTLLNERDLYPVMYGEERIKSFVDQLLDQQKDIFSDSLAIIISPLETGLVAREDKWAVITADEIFGKLPKARGRKRKSGRKLFSVNISDLDRGDLVVHRQHGVGRFISTKEMTIGSSVDEYIELEYADRQRLFLPIREIHLIKKYIGAGGGKPALDRMGGASWQKRRKKIRKAVMEMAGRLLRVYAARKIGGGIAHSPDTDFHTQFASAFAYQLTEDQANAINDIALDMEANRPMDRLVCGDVGYGKTEVAMQAAFKAVYDGKQVAILAPTTILAQQHYQTFTDRFSPFPVTVEVLSRFKSRAESKKIIEKAGRGEIDIVIGTHRLLQKDIRFHDLGLVVIDEEQRFGVKHKEKIRNMRSNVDVLMMSATPIPRTLHSSLLGIRDLSVIETPPVDRLAVRNIIAKFSDKVIKEAVDRELDRGGQVFFIHNKVRSMDSMTEYLKRICPAARVASAHGQMGEKELEKVMLDFMDRKFDILVATTIVESGLDISSANTMLINRADHFGLAQLYQLRGRVGRDRHRAYCYFLVPGTSGISDVAKKRLAAIEELSGLGAGFKLAARDMEIRGAGNLLGPEQSGNIDAVGFETYCEMIESAIKELKGEKTEEKFESRFDIPLTGRITPEYVPSINQRMELYERLYEAGSGKEIDDLVLEIKDRFGPIPETMEKLILSIRLKNICAKLAIEKVDIIRDRLILRFSEKTSLTPDRMVATAEKTDTGFRFTSGVSAEVIMEKNGWRNRYESVYRFLRSLQESL